MALFAILIAFFHILYSYIACYYIDIEVKQTTNFLDDIYKESWSRSSENKVKIGCIANIFQPGSANQISIRYDDWISEESIMYSPVIKKFYDFIIDILELN